ncbi:hypothetical protein D3C75_1274720 [compost metagenome]
MPDTIIVSVTFLVLAAVSAAADASGAFVALPLLATVLPLFPDPQPARRVNINASSMAPVRFLVRVFIN